MIEKEIKILNINPNKIRMILKKNKAKLIMKKHVQKTVLFETKKGVIRLRKSGDISKIAVKSNFRIVKNHKHLNEYETEIEDIEIMEKGLKDSGLKRIAKRTSDREDWSLHGCIVSLNKYRDIPAYLELEGNPKNIEHVARILGYSKKDYNPHSLFQLYGSKINK